MEKEQLKRVFEFLEANEGHNTPFRWKLINNEAFTKRDLNIKGNLSLSDIKITKLPEGLDVKGTLFLYDSEIKSLPEGLKVRGDLRLYGAKVLSLPTGPEVYGDLYIRNTELQKYPNQVLREMIAPGFIEGKIIR